MSPASHYFWSTLPPVGAAVDTLAFPVEPIVDTIASAVETVFNPIALPIQVQGALLMAIGRGTFGSVIQTIIDPFSLGVQSLIDAITPVIQAIFIILGKGVAQPEKEGEGGDCKQFRFHGVFS
jgi:hypothetical protein